MSNPLQDPSNWSKPYTLVVPVEITIMVDDPSNVSYKSLADEKVVKKILNELRSVCSLLDPSGKQLMVRFLESMTLTDYNKLKEGKSGSTVDLDKMIEEKLKNILGKK